MIIARLQGRDAFRASYFFSFCFNAFSLYWVALVTPPGIFTAIVIVAFYTTGVLTVFNKLYQIKPIYGIIAVPFLWVGLEHFRTLSEFAFPWCDLGYTQSYYLYILQIVSVISVHGLSLLLLTVNVLIWQILRPSVDIARKLTAGFVSVGIVVLLVAFGWAVVPVYPTPGSYPVTLLQGSIPIEEKWRDGNEEYSFRLYDSLARSVEGESQLFVWPETSAPSYLSHSLQDRRTVGNTARATGGYHLVGALGAEYRNETWRHYNSAYLFGPSGQLQGRYDKVKLVPFTEHVPYQDNLPFLRKEFLTKYLTFIETYGVQFWSDFYPGDSVRLFATDSVAFAPLICYEVTFPQYVRQMVLDGAEFLVEITNDTWFGHSVGIHMHSQAFVTRAVENRIWGVRSANSGLTYVVNGYGQIQAELELDEVAALTSRVKLLDEYSIFTRVGDVAGQVSLLITILLTAILVTRWLAKKVTARR